MWHSLIVFGGVALLLLATKSVGPRGLRNNNPLNIRWDGSTRWEGMTGSDSAGFVVFASKEYGYRAATKILMTYARRGVVTLEEIVSTWAPTRENETEAYIKNVSEWMGIERTRQIGSDRYPSLLAAMERMEVGRMPSDLAAINAGVMLAYA